MGGVRAVPGPSRRSPAHGPSWSVHGGLFPPGECERPFPSGRREAIMSDQRPRLGGASVPSTSVLLFHYTSYQPKTDAVQPIGNPNERLGIADASRMVSVRNNPPYRHSGSPDPTRQHSAAPHTTSTSMKIKSITSRLIHGSPIAFGHRPHSEEPRQTKATPHHDNPTSNSASPSMAPTPASLPPDMRSSSAYQLPQSECRHRTSDTGRTENRARRLQSKTTATNASPRLHQ